MIKRIMSKKKITLPSLRNDDQKTVNAESEKKKKKKKINELLMHISTNKIPELNSAGAK